MRVADLLRHSAGFDRMPNGDPMLLQNRTPPCPYALPEVRSYVLDFQPGTRYGYGNLNYCLLGVLAENAYGIPYRKLVQQRFVKEGKGEFSDGPYSKEEPKYDIRFENLFSENFWKSYDFSALSAAAGMRISAMELINIVKAERAHLKEYLAFANQYILPGVDCGKFMKCYSLMGSYYSANGRHANVWRGNMIGTAAMLIVMDDGSALAWLGGGQSPTQYRDDEKMFSFWFENMALTHSNPPTRRWNSNS
ncbi:hypothetical protein GCM10007205_03340 [Oxalicibacterium flavum]|uniref:Beta-lactamase-related domain-containing protein n=2 Tax=Oxalicibacterium flavum TaxID=179467 RepID=A0A8J2XXA1_9BURK|nr:hypothetical protein GCM10007205_03340 [Oxalicibacterium flavum]